MSAFNEDLKLKIALQTAIELRTCPDEAALYSTTIDSNLQKHLSICHACREKRSLDAEELNAWKILQEKFPGSDRQTIAGQQKQSGQVWMLAKKNDAWREDGRFLNTPAVLLLNEASQATWAVSQLYHDKRMMGGDDVPLAAKFGFAEGWNSYAIHESDLEQCLGSVNQDELNRVLAVLKGSVADPDDNSILSIFRSMELEIGASVAILSEHASLQALNINQWLENIFGNLSSVQDCVQKTLTGWKLPESASTVFDFFSGSEFDQAVGFAADSESIRTINLVSAEAKGLLVGTLTAVITADDQLDDGTYFVSGRLKEAAPETLYLLARLVSGDSAWETERITINVGTKAFSIKFKDAPTEVCTIDNVRMILVNP